jgi:mannose-6-phosphate isomerase-like protein (cupin superfamily)
MLQAGDSLENPVLGIRILICKLEKETGGNGFELEYFIKPHAGRESVAHLHQWWTEQFEILAGTAHYVLDGKEKAAQAGDVLVFPKGIPHIHPWNVGDSELHMRQTDRFDHASPAAVRDTLNVYATLYGLARDGKVNRSALPNPLQLAVMVRFLQRHGAYLGGLPPAIQQGVFGGLAILGRAFGFQPSYPKYTG